MIIRGGLNIYPAEVERFIKTHPAVLDCQVIGVPDDRVGEEICAWIKLHKPNAEGKGPDITDQQIKSFCVDNIAKFKIPRYIKFVDAFPTNAIGKIVKFKMQEQMIAELNLKSVKSAKN